MYGMASIKMYTAADGQTTWRVRYRLDRRSCSKTFKDQRSAEYFGDLVDRWGPVRALEFIKEPTTPREKKVTLKSCVERYIALRQGKTKRIYSDVARLHIFPALGEDTAISKLTPEMIQLWANTVGKSAATVKLAHSVLNGSLALAMSQGEISRNPAKRVSKTSANGVRLPRTRPTMDPVFLSHDEFDLVLKAVPEFYQLLVEFLVNAGCRIGEALALTPADVNMRTGKVRFNKSFSEDEDRVFAIGLTKTEGSEREIAMPRTILDRLDLSSKYIFQRESSDLMLDADYFRANVWSKAVEESGLPEHRQPRIHDLRHTHASWLLDAGISIHAIKERLGHSDVMTTLRIYGHAAADSEDRILSVLNPNEDDQREDK